MKYTVYDLGNKKRGEIVEIKLVGSDANVKLMDAFNYESYKNGLYYKYIGGVANRSPVRIQIPSSGYWFVTIDMQGLKGTVKSSIQVMPNAISEMRQLL